MTQINNLATKFTEGATVVVNLRGVFFQVIDLSEVEGELFFIVSVENYDTEVVVVEGKDCKLTAEMFAEMFDSEIHWTAEETISVANTTLQQYGIVVPCS